MTVNIEQEIDKLHSMSTPELAEKYQELCRQDPPKNNKRHMIRGIAWQLQAREEGGLSERARERAREIIGNDDPFALLRSSKRRMKDFAASKEIYSNRAQRNLTDERIPDPGSFISRKYKGKMHRVKVLRGEFEYKGKKYTSLTQIAEKITGSHWNGFDFFNLGKKEGPTGRRPRQIRCGVYIRKESDYEGVRSRNQRTACRNYIDRQRETEWINSGEYMITPEEPILQRILYDFENKGINCVVIYNVKHLNCSLQEFSELLEFLKQHKAIFVVVSQRIDTLTETGKLAVKALVSFSELKREGYSDRALKYRGEIRPKGKWAGGNVSLGYDLDPEGEGLIINEEEAETVREIFSIYLELKSIPKTLRELDRRGIKTKRRISQNGNTHGGNSFNNRNLYHMLTNVLYIGKIKHQGEIFEGEHEAIVDENVFRQVQEAMRENSTKPKKI